ncbi:MAG: repair protein RecN [Bacteroidota bacterium]
MLHRLFIENYALIDRLELSFSSGLTVMTGETGSGKSIVLGALGLVLGDRAEGESVRDASRKCIVEATFRVREHMRDFFEAHDLDFAPETIIRREIAPGGKSRSFVNDTPVAVRQLKELGEQLIDVHSQFETSNLRSREFRFHLLDAKANQLHESAEYSRVFKKLQQTRSTLDQLKEEDKKGVAEVEFAAFQLRELEEAGLETLNVADLEEEAAMHRNAEGIVEALQALVYAMEEGEAPVLAVLKTALQRLDAIAAEHRPSGELRERLNSVYIELSDLTREASSERDRIESDPRRLASIEEELDKVYALVHKHRLQRVEDLVDLQREFKERVMRFEGLTDEIHRVEKEIAALEQQVLTQGELLREGRIRAAGEMEKEIQMHLQGLKMPEARLKIELPALPTPGIYGLTDVEMLFSANKGMSLQPIERVASGGELSRFMLALKATLCAYQSLPTLILDEIDSGVSGEVAARVADTMRAMSAHVQLIAITHLPQVAGKAEHHLKVAKRVEGGTTLTGVVMLTTEGRVEEVAGMLSGDQITEAARHQARQLLAME